LRGWRHGQRSDNVGFDRQRFGADKQRAVGEHIIRRIEQQSHVRRAGVQSSGGELKTDRE